MSRGKRVSEELIAEVRKLKKEYPDMTYERIARFAGTSHATVGRILAGCYDRKDEPEPQERDDDMVLLLMEQNEKLDEVLRMMKSMMLAVAVIIDPKCGKTSAPVADAIRSAVRGKND